MTDDKGFLDAYSSIYKKDDENLKEEPITATILATKAAMAAKGALAAGKAAKIGAGLSKAAKVAGKVQTVADAAGSVGDAAHKIRGKGQHHPSQNEEVEGGVSVVDYNSDYKPTEIETVDVVPAPKMKGTEDLQEEEETLEERLWDQVAANLTTLGEMNGIKYKVSPLEEKKDDDEKEDDEDDDKKDKKKKDKTKNKDEKWQDSDGDGKWYEKGEDVKEGFNVKSPVVFSKKEEVEIDTSMLEEKCASSIKKAHKAIKK
tara:strand:+ start:906 stop:1682 length:777 start_codon:yes stop_codon:yes gene_type:complete